MKTRNADQRGFSFIEVLVVMGILAVLGGMVVVAVGIWSEKKPVTESEMLVKRVTQLIESWKMRFDGVYPPTMLVDLPKVTGQGEAPKKVDNHSNEGSETLYQAFYYPGFGTEPDLKDSEVANTDDDRLAKGFGTEGPELREIIDAWGNPLVYFESAHYAKFDESPATYFLGEKAGGGEVQARPWKGDRGFEQPKSFQVFSMGPDGEPNTDDDIKGWGG